VDVEPMPAFNCQRHYCNEENHWAAGAYMPLEGSPSASLIFISPVKTSFP
jgi:hypothetical protein